MENSQLKLMLLRRGRCILLEGKATLVVRFGASGSKASKYHVTHHIGGFTSNFVFLGSTMFCINIKRYIGLLFGVGICYWFRY